MPIDSSPLAGTGLHAIGAAAAALCYAPQRHLKKWSWQTYWLLQAAVCWLVLPWVFAWITIPDLGEVLAEAPRDAMLKSYALGAIYGIGGIAFGVAIRYVGYSLTYALAISISSVLGTLLPPLLAGTLGQTLSSAAGAIVICGVLVGGGAMFVTGYAGFRRERETAGAAGAPPFNARIGLPLVILAGTFAAFFSLSLAAAAPIAAVAARHGAGALQGNVMYIFSNNGAFTTTLLYAGWLSTRARTWGEYTRSSEGGHLPWNYFLAILTGFLWYFQFFFYGLGHVRMGRFDFSSWAIHMIILIIFSCGFGVLIGEWKRSRAATKLVLAVSIALLVGAIGLITWGNYLAAPRG